MLHSPHDTQPRLELTRHLPDPAATDALGAALARVAVPGLVIHLSGDLGAGKTALVRAFLHALGHTGKVKSPTYTLVEPYVVSGLNLYHFDLYRFSDPHEWEEAGFREYFNADSICLVEWPEKAAGVLPGADIRITLDVKDSGRDAVMAAETDVGEQCLTRMDTTP